MILVMIVGIIGIGVWGNGIKETLRVMLQEIRVIVVLWVVVVSHPRSP
jgi:hypothetical protein